MSTSLARQLKKLQAPQTDLLKLDKKKPSILFDPKEAANINRDAIYDLGNFNSFSSHSFALFFNCLNTIYRSFWIGGVGKTGFQIHRVP